MASIELAPGVLAHFDDADSPLVAGRHWYLWRRVTTSGRVYEYARSGRAMLMHRLLSGAGPGLVVDHIDGDGLNNRRANLRLCTHAENMRNRRINVNSPSGFKGVTRRPSGNYDASIRAGRVRRRKGGFKTAEEAAACYAAMARELHGDFARIDRAAPEPAKAA